MLRTIGGSLPQLRLLSLAGCAGVDDIALGELLDALPQTTKHARRRSAAEISPGHVPSPPLVSAALTHLCVRNCNALTDVSIERIIGAAGGVQDLCAFGCRRLTDAGLLALSCESCPNLRHLNVIGAYKVIPCHSAWYIT